VNTTIPPLANPADAAPAPPTKSARWRPSANTLLVVPLVLVVAYLIIPPLAILLYGAVTDTPPAVTPNFTWDTLVRAYGRGTIYPALVNSVIYAACTSTLVLIVGGFLAWVVERTDSAVRRMTDLFALAPVLMPAILLISGWILILGPRSGLVNLMAREYLGMREPLINLFSFPGMVWVGMLQELPLAFLWLWPSFRAMNPELEEAGLVSGASMLTVMRVITLPILRPTIVAAWIIFFIYSLGALSVPLLIGLPAKIFLYSTEIYLATTRIPSDLNLASAYILLFLAITITGIFFYRKATADAARFVTISGRAYNPRLIRLGHWQYLITALAVVLLLLVAGLPLFVLVWNAFMPYPQVPSMRSLDLITFENFTAALDYGPAKRAVINSFGLGIAAGFIATALGALVAWSSLRLKTHRRWLAVLDQLSTTPIAIPGMIVGVGLVWLYLVLPIPIYGTHWILLIAYVAIHMPFAVRICSSGLTQIHQELEEAGAVSGAGRFKVLHRIVVPLVAANIVASILYVSLRSFREYTASIFLTAPGTEVFSVLVLDMWEGGNSNILSAYVSMVMGVIGVAVAILYWIGRRIGFRK
jgi:iron(III) transport system permease protein